MRPDWNLEELTIAFDSCPKVHQSYSQHSQQVVEIGDLLNRTGAAISRVFANMWFVLSNGTAGLAHASKLCQTVVETYRDKPKQLQIAADRLRRPRTRVALSPRIRIRSRSNQSILNHDTVKDLATWYNLGPTQFFHVQSVEAGVEDFGFLASAAISHGERISALQTEVARLLRGSKREILQLTESTGWRLVSSGRLSELERRVIHAYLPRAELDLLTRVDQARLALFLSLLRGVKVDGHPSQTNRRASSKNPSQKSAALKEALGIDTRRLSVQDRSAILSLVELAEGRKFWKEVGRMFPGRT